MNKTMRMLTTALLALVCVPTLPANAMELPVVKGGDYEDMELAEYEMLSGYAPLIYVKGDTIHGVTPRGNNLRFVLKEGIDKEEAIPQILSVLETEYSGITERYDTKNFKDGASLLTSGTRYFEVEDLTLTAGSPEISEHIMKGLAAKGLISEFYSWGQTATDVVIHCGFHEPAAPEKPDPLAFGEDLTAEQVSDLQSYLTAHYPEYTLIERGEDEDAERFAKAHIQTPDNITLAEKLAVCDELKKNVGVCGGAFSVDASMPEEGVGHNSLEKKGDVTLDCEVDIMDVIATNKYLLGAKTLCNTAEKNADVSGDGTPDESDSLAILKEVLGLTTD